MRWLVRHAWRIVVCAALLALEPASTSYADTGTQPVIWCSADLVTEAENSSDPDVVAQQKARRSECQGDSAATVRALTSLLPDMRNRYKGDGTHWIDFGRTYFYALLATHDNDGARRFLNEFENGWKPAPEEREFWGGDYVRSFAAYVADDSAVVRTPDMTAAHTLDPHLTYALNDLRAKDGDDAIREQLAVADTGSLYGLMLGNLYAEQHAWPQAFAAWVKAAAAGPGFAQPEFYTLDRWNESALEMIYYYRAHAPERAPDATVSCGSPHDLAVVEQLALALPQAGGADASRIIDAVIAGGTDARVNIETKGAFTAYFELHGGAWHAVATAPAKVAFPNGCANPRFVNHPSGA